ncbi:hypothetical protein H5410_017181 [Solanum commersonii]|uniref:Uncharacterized protein n=1 Tax=Solanum commersonii TaxID=4109 RepID=A0A9J5ZYF3_SOLCO|nr:hypothetical protein H5410_017181 [Solanum commersonii]
MISIFSSFDALSAEILGQKVNHSWAPPTSDNKQQQGVGPLVSDLKIAVSPPSISATGKLNKTEEAPPPSSSSKSPSRPRRPKFAPELDGVYCFETIPPSFDALSAEFFGLKVSRSWASATSDNKQQQGLAPLVSNRKTAASPPSTSSPGELNKAGEAAAPSSSKSPSRPQQQRRLRFAPELDGVHCFETILPY